MSLCDTDLYVICDLKWTAEALGNIVDNAIKYTLGGGTVQMKVEKYSSFVKVDVIDDGIGIEKGRNTKDIWKVLPKPVSSGSTRGRSWFISCKRDYSGAKRICESEIKDWERVLHFLCFFR